MCRFNNLQNLCLIYLFAILFVLCVYSCLLVYRDTNVIPLTVSVMPIWKNTDENNIEESGLVGLLF